MAAKICYNCGKKLHGDSPNCTNCGAHQWREGTDRMSVEQLKEKADDEFRQAKLAKGEEEYRQGKYYEMLPGENLDDFLKRVG